MRINSLSALRQYISNLSEMSNSSQNNLNKLTSNSVSISDLLQNLSLKPNQQNKLIAQQLLNANLPLKKNLIAELHQFLTNHNLNRAQKANIKTAILLKQLNLPLNKKFFNLFANYGQHSNSLSEDLNKFLTKHTNLLTVQQNTQPSTQLSLTTSQLLKKLNLSPPASQHLNIHNQQKPITVLKKLISALTNSKSQLPNKQAVLNHLQRLINNQPQLLNQLKQNIPQRKLTQILTTSQLKQLTKPNSQTTLNPQKILQQLNLSPESIKQLNISSNPTPHKLIDTLINHLTTNQPNSQLTTKVKNLFTNQPQLLLKLQQQISTNKLTTLLQSIPFSQAETKQLLNKNLTQILAKSTVTPENLTSNQIKTAVNNLNPNSNQNKLMELLFNLNSSISPNENSQLTANIQNLLYQLTSLKTINSEHNILQLFFPVMIKNNIQLVQLKIHKDTLQNKEKEEQILQFAFAIDTDKLGTVEAKVKIHNQQINTLFVADKKQTQQLIEKYKSKFEEKFAKLDYNLNYFKCKVADKELTTEDKQEVNLHSIDFTI